MNTARDVWKPAYGPTTPHTRWDGEYHEWGGMSVKGMDEQTPCYPRTPNECQLLDERGERMLAPEEVAAQAERYRSQAAASHEKQRGSRRIPKGREVLAPEVLADLLRRLDAVGIEQTEAAKRLGIGRRSMGAYLHGRRSVPVGWREAVQKIIQGAGR